MENCHHYFSLTYFHVCVWVANVYTFYYTITLSLLDILKSTLHIKHVDIHIPPFHLNFRVHRYIQVSTYRWKNICIICECSNVFLSSSEYLMHFSPNPSFELSYFLKYKKVTKIKVKINLNWCCECMQMILIIISWKHMLRTYQLSCFNIIFNFVERVRERVVILKSLHRFHYKCLKERCQCLNK